MKKMNIAIFAGSKCLKSREKYFYKVAYQTGKLLAEAGFTVITGAGMGLMNETLRGANDAGGKTIGIVLDKKDWEHSSFTSER